jgi:predicted Zn-dependent protease
MAKAGYNVNEALKYWENMSKGKEEGSDFFSTHPNSSTRIDDIRRVINKLPKS